MATRKKNILLVLIITVLLLPMAQQYLQVVDSGKLYGYYTDVPDVKFSWGKWFDGSYQEQKTNFFNDHVGFRPDLIRVNAQIDYSLFSKVYYANTVLGTDNYLYFSEYIDAYYGKDYKGYAELSTRVGKLKALQDTMAKEGKLLLMVYAPCKVWYTTEHIPDFARSKLTNPNNYITSVRIGDSLGVNQIDFNKWFLALRDTVREPLFAKLGIHWTNYGSILGADSIIKYIEHYRHACMPHPAWDKAVHTADARHPDNDMGNITNLIFPITKETLYYPELYYRDTGCSRPRAIFVGDSYNANFLATGIMQQVFKDWQYWFGFKVVYNETNYAGSDFPKMEDYDWKSVLNNAACVIVLNTPMNIKHAGGGFIEATYEYYFPESGVNARKHARVDQHGGLHK